MVSISTVLGASYCVDIVATLPYITDKHTMHNDCNNGQLLPHTPHIPVTVHMSDMCIATFPGHFRWTRKHLGATVDASLVHVEACAPHPCIRICESIQTYIGIRFMGVVRMRQQWCPGHFFSTGSTGSGLGTRLICALLSSA